MRKKMLLVVCSVILCISIIGCGASKEKENNSIQSVIEDNSIEEVTEPILSFRHFRLLLTLTI